MANIKINQTPSRVQYTATAAQTVFAYNFPIKADSDLKVYKRAAAADPDDTTDLLTFGAANDYTVTGANTAQGGTIILNAGATAGDIVTIMGDKPVDRTAIYDQSVTLSKADLNNDFNDNIMFDKQLQTQMDELTPSYHRSELIGPATRSDNLKLPILNDGYVWQGRGDNGDSPDDIIALDLANFVRENTISAITTLTAVGSGTTANLNATYNNGAAGVGATLTNAGALAAFSTDGVTPGVSARVLVKNQTNQFENGIYTVTTAGDGATAWVLTRATDNDEASENKGGEFTVITAGTTLANTAWIQTEKVTTMGADNIIWVQFGPGGGTYGPIDATYITQTPNASLTNEQALSALGTGIVKNTTGTGVLSIAAQGVDYYAPGGTDVAVADGGTGGSSHTPYAVLCGGTTGTGAIQSIAGVGTSGQILTSNGAGALPTFQNAAGGAWVKIASASAAASASIDFDNVLDGTYEKYMIAIDSAVNATNNITLRGLVGTGAGPTYQTSSYVANSWCVVTTTAGVTNAGANTADINITAAGVANNGTGPGVSGFVYIHDPANTSTSTRVTTIVECDNAANSPASHRGGGVWNSTTAVTSFQLKFSAGNITSGEFTLYGLSTA